jgi:hypothetical protein
MPADATGRPLATGDPPWSIANHDDAALAEHRDLLSALGRRLEYTRDGADPAP